MRTIRNIDQLRAEQLKRSLKRARLEAHLHHQWKHLHQRPVRLLSVLGWAMPLVTSLLRKRKHHWFDFFR